MNLQLTNKKTEENDEFLQQILEVYLSKDEEVEVYDFFTLYCLSEIHREQVRCCSLKNERLYNDWKNFVHNLPESKNEIIPRPLEKYWRWKMYKKYIPEERTNFRKSMKSGPGSDVHGLLPMSFEDTCLYRQPQTVQKSLYKKKN